MLSNNKKSIKSSINDTFDNLSKKIDKISTNLNDDPIIKYIKISEINTNFEGDAPSYATVNNLMEAIKNNEEIPPILISENNYLQDGRHRLRAYKNLGYDKVPTIIGYNVGVSGIMIDDKLIELEIKEYKGQKYKTPVKKKIDGISANNEYLIGASIIANMSEEERDNLDPADAKGGYGAYILYEAQKLLPNPSNKLKRVNDNNTFALYQNYYQIANIDGIYYGISHFEDPDNIDEDDESKNKYVFAYQRLDEPNSPTIETMISIKDVQELIDHIKNNQKSN